VLVVGSHTVALDGVVVRSTLSSGSVGQQRRVLLAPRETAADGSLALRLLEGEAVAKQPVGGKM